jgi:hypothetical protein
MQAQSWDPTDSTPTLTSFACGERSVGLEASVELDPCLDASSAFIFRSLVRAAARDVKGRCQRVVKSTCRTLHASKF